MDRPDLAQELEGLAAEDQEVRQRLVETGVLFQGYHPEMRAVHRRNGERLTVILDELRAWPGFRLVGGDGSRAALLIAQHDIANPTLMRRCRALYSAAVDDGEADPGGLAYLDDRIRTFEGRYQRYGTQLGWNDEGELDIWPPVEDPERTDERRARLGLPPASEALRAVVRRDAADGLAPRRPVAEVLAHRWEADEFARATGWRSD